MRVRRLGARRRRGAARARTEGQRHERHRRGSPRAATASAGRQEAAHRSTTALSKAVPPGQLFAPTSFWNQRLEATTALDPNSAALVAALVGEVQRERAAAIGPWIGTGSGSTPVYLVPATQRRVRVNLLDGGLHGRRTLQRAFASVPLPPDRQAGPGGRPPPDGLAALDRQALGVLRCPPRRGRMARALGWRDPSRVAEPGLLHARGVAGRRAQLGRDGQQPASDRRHDAARRAEGGAHRSRARDQPPGSARGSLRLAGPADGRHRRPHGASRRSAPAPRSVPRRQQPSTSRSSRG